MAAESAVGRYVERRQAAAQCLGNHQHRSVGVKGHAVRDSQILRHDGHVALERHHEQRYRRFTVHLTGSLARNMRRECRDVRTAVGIHGHVV